MKKVVVVTNKLVYGGIEKALIEFLKLLIKKYKVTLVVNEFGGDLYDKIPNEVNVECMTMAKTAFRIIKLEHNLSKKILKIFQFIRLKVEKNYAKQCELLSQIYPKLSESFDLAISYSQPVSLSNYYVINNIVAKKKVMFIHNDVAEIDVNPALSENLYKKYDHFFAVSLHAKNSFLSYFPYLNNRVSVLYNPINVNAIISNSNIPVNLKNSNCINICTVGRIEYEKGQDIVPYVICELNKQNLYVNWYLVGEGRLENKIKKLAVSLNVHDQIIFTNYQENPYKYMKNCDIYVQTSRQEGFGITLTEAKILNKLIVTTDFPCAFEQIENDFTGVIVEFDYGKIALALINLIKDKSKQQLFIINLKKFKYKNDISEIDDMLTD